MLCGAVSVLCLAHVLTLAISGGSAEQHTTRPPTSDFKRYTIVQPVLQHGRTKRHIFTTKDMSGVHHSEVTMTIPMDGEELILDLRLNHDLLTDNHLLSYQEKGKTVLRKPKNEEIDLCHYGGAVRDKPGSWVAVSTCHGVQGVVFDGHAVRYIEPAQGGDITSKHYVYDQSDPSVSTKCGTDDRENDNTPHNRRLYHNDKEPQESRMIRHKRHTYDEQVRAPYNADERSRYVELVLVADYSQYQASGRKIQTVYRQMQTLANIVNSVFSSINIFIALVGVVVWNERDMIRLSSNSSVTLEQFIQYRRNVLLRNMPNDNAHLVTGQQFTDGIIGKAYTGSMCSFNYSGGVSTKHTSDSRQQAMTIAHELGHNLGMDHDNDALCQCPGHKCVMSPASTHITPTHWSSCSLASLATSYWQGLDYCLRNKPERLFVSQRSSDCGNGFVEPGEQCDCGTTSVPRTYNPCHVCCDPSTCRLRANATCGAGKCCDLQTCRPKSAGTVCRSADRECDLPEYCTGDSEYCPDDVYKMDTTPCGKGEQSAYCVRGWCQSHLSQCRLLWGTTGENSHFSCYNKNVNGDEYGNCGYNPFKQRHQSCARDDAKCGRLHCTHLSKHLEFGRQQASTGSTSYNYGDEYITCHVATIDMGLDDVDPGMVPDGAKCGDQKMCLSQRCVSVAALRQSIKSAKSSVCPSDCSGHGVCNSAGECHCEAGFAPPLCDKPGVGGSYSSGLATDPAIQRNVMVAMYVIFLGIIPAILLILFLIYYFCPDVFSHCNNRLRQKVKCCSYFDESMVVQKTSKYKNTELRKKYKETPDIIHNLLNDNNISKHPNNTVDLPNNLRNKTDSVIYTNIETLKYQKKIFNAPNENLRSAANLPTNVNVEFGPIHKSNDKLPKSNLSNAANINEIHRNMQKIPINIVHPPSLHKTSADVDNSRNDSLHKPPSKEFQSPSLRKSPSNAVALPCGNFRNPSVNKINSPKDDFRSIPQNAVNVSNVKLRPAPVNKVQSSSNHLQSRSDNTVDLSNVKLRKTPGKVVDTSNVNLQNNEAKSGNLPNGSVKKITPPKPFRKIYATKPQVANNRN